MKEVLVPNVGKVALVDAQDYEMVSKHTWCWDASRCSVNTNLRERPGRRGARLVSMHRMVARLLPGDGQEVHHRDRNPFNNMQSNLVVVSRKFHMMIHLLEQPPKPGRKKGVEFREDCKRHWRAQIMIGKQKKHLGLFLTEDEAARAYDKAATEAYGEIPELRPYLNFPDGR